MTSTATPKRKRRPQGLRLKNEDGQTPELYIYDAIGPEWAGMISADMVLSKLEELKDASEIIVRLNSPGGDVFEGFAIHNALRRHKAKIIIEVDALAASIASVIAMAGDTIRIAENAMMMIHNSWTIALGNKLELAKVVDLLAKIDDTIVDSYAARTGMDRDELVEMMDAETWMKSDEALEMGFADERGAALQVKGKVEAGLFRNAPKDLVADGQPCRFGQAAAAVLRELQPATTQTVAACPRIAAALARKNSLTKGR